MAKHLLIILCFSISTIVSAQRPVVYINAGSRAPWGNTQELTIYPDGRCTYYVKEVNGPIKDSSFFNITASDLQSFFTSAASAGFFTLNNKYDGGKADGSGIYISLNNAGQKKAVQLNNTDVPAVQQLISRLNEILLPQKIRIYYGQPSPGK